MEMKSLKDSYQLKNGVKIPCVGFGTYLTPDGDTTVRAVKEAIRVGYRHMDTAAVYKNEKSVGRAIRESEINRNALFVTSKVWNKDQGFDSTLRAFEKTLSDLELEYLDLYLIHWPVPKGHDHDWKKINRETWRAMEQLLEEGRVRAIGVSNFKAHHLNALMETAVILPMVDQIEIHPGLNQNDTIRFCKEHDMVVEAWGPLSQGKLFQINDLDELAERYQKTVAQICLRWHLQRGVIPLPKSVTPARMAENADIFDFELSREDMDYISRIKCGSSGLDPDIYRG